MPAGYTQEVKIDDDARLTDKYHGYLYLAGSGEVEIQLLTFAESDEVFDSDPEIIIEDSVVKITEDSDVETYEIYVDDKLVGTV